VSFIKKLFKFILTLILLSILTGAGYYFYDEYTQQKKDELELSYASKSEWKWHDKYDRIQITTLKDKSILRKVNLNKSYVIYAYKNADYSLSAWVKFVTKCEPNKDIVTAEKFSSGASKNLKCNEDGTALNYEVKWSGGNTEFTWEENLGGFSLRENFTYWDFSALDQEVTLSKAQ
jgi:hypothetical protein